MGTEEDEDQGCYASPPCFMHELGPAYLGFPAEGEAQQPTEVSGLDDDELARLGATVIRTIPDAVIYADHRGVIRFWNAGAMRIFGFSADEAIGRSLDIIIPERLRERHWSGYHHMMETGQGLHGPAELLAVPATSKSGEALSIQFTVTPIHGAEGRFAGIAAVLRDVTATFQELKRLRARSS